jgi:hypothetical protein
MIQSIEQLLQSKPSLNGISGVAREDLKELILGFTQEHVRQALQAVTEKAIVDYSLHEDYKKTLLVDENIEVYLINASVFEAYPLTNIK